MAITIGLDFGTHQTKICIENSNDPMHKTYEFWRWANGEYTLPSVIQINKDFTLRYGSIDSASCLSARKIKTIPCPEPPEMPEKPVYMGIPEPPKPSPSDKPSSKFNDLSMLKKMMATTNEARTEVWKNKYKHETEQYHSALKIHKKQWEKHLSDVREWEDKRENLRLQYEHSLKQHKETQQELPMIFRYFKQATFSSRSWDYEIPAEKLTIVYLAYIIFQLQERFGKDFSIQMGVPTGAGNFEYLKKRAAGYLIQAIRLVEDVFNNDFNEFLSTPYEELFVWIPEFEVTDDLKQEYGIIVIPEAYAALRSITKNARISRGMTLMIDMGGGTTDLSFFCTQEAGEPLIYHYDSIDKGLNFFLEFDENDGNFHDISKKKELEDLSETTFLNAYKKFQDEVRHKTKHLNDFLHNDTIHRGFGKHRFSDALENRPVVYTGGGCYDKRLRKEVLAFTDVKYVDKALLNIPHVIDENNISIPYSIMATSFGLSIAREDDNISLLKPNQLFEKYHLEKPSYDDHREHGLADT